VIEDARMPAKRTRAKRVTVMVRADRRRLEVLRLEIQRLASRLGVSVGEIRVRRVAKAAKRAR
jgi:hypothetical protein